ncbi:MAG: SusC/RagA family TonB-linked outer membrane protein, partial [Bacteroidia bacterium]
MRKKMTLLISHSPTRMSKTLPLVMLLFLSWSVSVSAKSFHTDLFQSHTVTGIVTAAEDGSALLGVSIQVKGKAKGTITNQNGDYTLEIDNQDAILIFSYIGYFSQEIPVNGQLVIDVQMVQDTKTLDEVVVIGYGTQKKINLSGAVDVVQSKQIVNRPVSNVSQALQGLSPNLNITVGADGGALGGRMDMNIRGMGSINGGSPYVLVDGIEQDIYKLNPSDIESITVLKDAASSAIYGARAAFGVVLVTTKKGRTDGISVNYSNNYAFATPTIVPHSVNSLDFAEYFNVGAVNSRVDKPFLPVIMDNMERYQAHEIDYWTIPIPYNPQFWLSYNGSWANTDWYEESYKKWVPNNIHNLSVSGGNENTQFYISGSTFSQDGLYVYGWDNHRRNTLSARVNTKVYDWLRFNFLSKLSSTNTNRPSYNNNEFYFNLARQWPTNAPYYPDGSLAGEAVQIWLERGGRYDENQNEITVVPGVEIEPVKGWIIYGNYRWKMNPSGSTNHVAKVYGTDVYGLPHLLSENNYFNMSSYESTYN